MKGFLRELRRRRVFRMTALYLVAAWAAVQVASELLPALDLPDRAIRYVWLAVLIGFPVAVLFSWRYELSDGGIRRTPPARGNGSEDQSLQAADYAVLVALGLVLLVTAFGAGRSLVDVRDEIAQAPATRNIEPNSLAVLPLENLSADADTGYFAAGLHDALITTVSRVSSLRVTSRTSTLRIGQTLSVPEIGRRLGVAKLVEGSVLIDGDRVRVIVQLIDAATDLHLWAQSYEREIADIIGLQNEIARTIAEVIQARVTPAEAAELARAEPVRPDVYRDYLKGMYQFRQESIQADRRGVELLEAVVARAPELALAHAGVAYGYAHIAHSPFPGEAYPKARAAADAALRLDPGLAEAHLAVGMYRLYYEWDIEGAERALERAIEINSSLTEAHYHLAWLYEMLGPGREEASLVQGERTRALDPLSPFMLGWLAVQYRDACRLEEALVIAREAIRVAPEFPIGWLALGEIYADLGEFDEAIEAHGHLADHPAWSWEIATSYAAAGLEDRALEIARQLEAAGAPPWPLALIHARLGDAEAALHWVAQAELARLPWYPWLLGWLPARETIADDPRLRARAAALGLPDPRAMGCGR